MDIATGAFVLAGAVNFSAITGATWFIPLIIGIFIGMWARKFL